MSICVSRPAGGISLNAGIPEFLCNTDGSLRTFESKEDAVEYLEQHGLENSDIEFLDFREVCKNCGEPLELYGECFTCGKPPAKS